MEYLLLLLVFVVGYFVGGINFSVVISRVFGKIDIRQHGSGNAGGTNVARTMGLQWGILVIVLEILKNLVVAFGAKWFFPVNILPPVGDVTPELCGCVAVLGCTVGNMYPCYYKFNGGKGVTTAATLMIMLDWRIFLVLLALFIVLVAITRMVSVASVTCMVGVIASSVIFYVNRPMGWLIIIGASAVALLVVWRHRVNLVRVFNGTENKFNFGKKK